MRNPICFHPLKSGKSKVNTVQLKHGMKLYFITHPKHSSGLVFSVTVRDTFVAHSPVFWDMFVHTHAYIYIYVHAALLNIFHGYIN
jgi:hypothetical protein